MWKCTWCPNLEHIERKFNFVVKREFMGDKFKKYREAIFENFLFLVFGKRGKKLEWLLSYIRELCWERSAMHAEDSEGR